MEAIKSLWECGQQVDIETVFSRGYKQLAEYMTKERQENGDRSFICSLNMAKPTEEPRVISESEGIYVEVPAGCIELEREELSNEFGCFCFVRYELPRTKRYTHDLFDRPDCYHGADLILTR